MHYSVEFCNLVDGLVFLARKTHLAGATLDRVYVSKSVLEEFEVTFFFLSVFSFMNIHDSQDSREKGRLFL